MREPAPTAIQLSDYRAPDFLIDHVALDVDIRAEDAIVKATIALRRNPASRDAAAPLALDGDELELVSVAVDGTQLRDSEFQLEPTRLTLGNLPARFTLETVSRIVPQQNTKLEGLYASKIGFVTQCEAQGFRRITWFLDRPDVMTRYVTTIHADKTAYPVLLSNGNLVEASDEPGGRHRASFEDPFPKPSYLFALVAGDLASLDDTFVTRSGRPVTLRIFVERKDLDKCAFGM